MDDDDMAATAANYAIDEIVRIAQTKCVPHFKILTEALAVDDQEAAETARQAISEILAAASRQRRPYDEVLNEIRIRTSKPLLFERQLVLPDTFSRMISIWPDFLTPRVVPGDI